MAKPILRQNRIKKPYATRNDATPGWVYIFRDSARGMVKIGLSRNPDRRKYYLSREYGHLSLVAKVRTFNMAWLERRMHRQYSEIRKYQDSHLNGFTEWFEADWLKSFEMRISLYIQSVIVNGSYFLGVFAILALLALLIF